MVSFPSFATLAEDGSARGTWSHRESVKSTKRGTCTRLGTKTATHIGQRAERPRLYSERVQAIQQIQSWRGYNEQLHGNMRRGPRTRRGSHMHTAEHPVCAQMASMAFQAAEANHPRHKTYLFHDARSVGRRQVFVQLPDRPILLPTAGARARIRDDVSSPPPSAVGKTNSASGTCDFCAHATGGGRGCCRLRGERSSGGWRGMTRAWLGRS